MDYILYWFIDNESAAEGAKNVVGHFSAILTNVMNFFQNSQYFSAHNSNVFMLHSFQDVAVIHDTIA